MLIARGSFPYDRVLLVLAELPFPTRAAQLAIDLVRMVGAELHLAVVHQPELVVGAQLREEVLERRREVEQLAGLYHVTCAVEELEGNPIEAVVSHSARLQRGGAALQAAAPLVAYPPRRGPEPDPPRALHARW